MITSRTFVTLPGASTVVSPSLSGVRILGVKRSGLGLTEVPVLTLPADNEFRYFVSQGRIQVPPSNPFNAGEKMWVLYET